MQRGRAYGLFGVSTAMAGVALWLTVGVADAQPSSPLPAPATVNQALTQAREAASPASTAPQQVAKPVVNTVTHIAQSAPAPPKVDSRALPKPPTSLSPSVAVTPPPVVKQAEQAVAPSVKQVEQTAAPVTQSVQQVVESAPTPPAPVQAAVQPIAEEIAPAVASVQEDAPVATPPAPAVTPPTPVAEAVTSPPAVAQPAAKPMAASRVHSVTADPVASADPEPLPPLPVTAPAAASAHIALPPVDLAPQATLPFMAEAAPVADPPPAVDIVMSAPAPDMPMAVTSTADLTLTTLEIDSSGVIEASPLAPSAPIAAFTVATGTTRFEPLQPPPSLPFESSTAPPPIGATAASGALGSGLSPGSGMTLLYVWLLLAAAWRALSVASRGHPLGIRLPELSPPG